MQRVVSFAGAVLCGAVFISPAGAETPAGTMPPPPASPVDAFMQQDTDGDGKVSLAEVQAAQKQRFDEADADKNGAVTAEEASAAFQAKVPPETLAKMKERGMPDMGEMFVKRFDTNGDGKVEQTEFAQPALEAFKNVDTDGNGFASKDEVAAFVSRIQKQMQEEIERMKQQGQEPPAPAK